MGLAQAASASEAIPNVVVTMGPIQSYVDSILKSVASSKNILRPGQDPHTFALTPSQAKALDSADFIIVPDMGMNEALAKAIAARPKLHVIELSSLPGVNALPYAAENPWLAAVKDKGGEKDDDAPLVKPVVYGFEKKTKEPVAKPTPAVDPHFWLDPERMAAIAVPLAREMARYSPDNAATLRSNAEQLALHLRNDVLPGMRNLLVKPVEGVHMSAKPIVPFITYHAAYQYFLNRFGLAHTGEITARPEEYMGAKTLANLLAKAKLVSIRCIIGENESPLTKRISAESGAKLVILSPEQNVEPKEVPPLGWIDSDYDRLMYKTAKVFGGCLNSGISY